MDYLNQIVTGDCRELAKELPDESVALALLDPPYNVGKDFGELTDDNRDDYEDWCMSWFYEARRISRAVLITPGIGNLAMWMKREPRWVIAWLKTNSMKRVTVGFNCWEPVLLWGKPALNSYRDVVDVPVTPQSNGHPTPKPLRLFQKLIEAFSKPGDTVCDFFGGSGTTAVAAKLTGRNFIVFEINDMYATEARERVRDTQPPLFVPGETQMGLAI